MRKAIVVLAACALTGCEPLPEEQKPTITVTDFQGGVIKTVKHDDHTFVVCVVDDGVSMIHHPACPMEKGEE